MSRWFPKKDTVAWKLVGSATGSSIVTIPNSFNELKIVSYDTVDRTLYMKTISIYDIKNFAPNDYFYDGFYLGSSNNGSCAWRLNSTKTGISCQTIHRNGNETTGVLTTNIYYR